MKRLITLIFLLFILSSTVFGSEYYWMQTYTKGWKNSYRSEFLGGGLSGELLNSLDSIYAKVPIGYYFFYNGEELQSYISCGFDLYSINEGELKLKYNYFNRGYTCHTTPFVRDSTNYLLGGHGFWTNHFDLLRFDEIHGSWEIVNTINQPIDYFSSGVYQNSKGIYSLFGGRANPRTGLEEKVPNGYFLDWESKEWKEIEIQIDGVDNIELVSKGKFQFLQTKDYFFMVSNSDFKNMGWNIIEKESGKIYFFDDLKNEDIFISPFVEVIENIINYQTPNGTPKSLDIEHFFTLGKEVGRIEVLNTQYHVGTILSTKSGVYVVIIIILILIIINLLFRKRGGEPLPNGYKEIQKLTASITQYSGELLHSEKLDEVLGIDKIENTDSKRLKRSRLINRLNEYHNSKKGTDLIVRDKNPEDKRYIYYQVKG